MKCGTVGCDAESLYSCCNVPLCALDFNQHRANVHYMPPVTANNRQVGGKHYQIPIQPWDFIVANDIGFLEGNAIKYICRHLKTATGKKDLEKAIHYLQKALEVYYPTRPDEEKKLDFAGNT